MLSLYRTQARLPDADLYTVKLPRQELLRTVVTENEEHAVVIVREHLDEDIAAGVIERAPGIADQVPTVEFLGAVEDFEDFQRRYTLVRNRRDRMAGMGGFLFGTGPDEWEEVLANPTRSRLDAD